MALSVEVALQDQRCLDESDALASPVGHLAVDDDVVSGNCSTFVDRAHHLHLVMVDWLMKQWNDKHLSRLLVTTSFFCLSFSNSSCNQDTVQSTACCVVFYVNVPIIAFLTDTSDFI